MKKMRFQSETNGWDVEISYAGDLLTVSFDLGMDKRVDLRMRGPESNLIISKVKQEQYE